MATLASVYTVNRYARTPEQIVDGYIELKGTCCSWCLSGDIQGSRLTMNHGTAWQEMSWNECHAQWSDVYKLQDIDPLRLGYQAAKGAN